MRTEITALVYEIISLCCGLKQNEPRLPEECVDYNEEISIASVNCDTKDQEPTIVKK